MKKVSDDRGNSRRLSVGDALPSPTGRAKKKYRERKKEPVHTFPVQPRFIQRVNKPKSFVDHSYNDFSCVPITTDYSPATHIGEMTFSQKVHHMLSDEANQHIITWMPHGRAFKIVSPKKLEAEVLPKYFDIGHFSRFRTSLRKHGFKNITKGVDQGCFYHECFLKDLPHLCQYMPVHLIETRPKQPDPENEPDFYSISERFPLHDRKLPAVVDTPHDQETVSMSNASKPDADSTEPQGPLAAIVARATNRRGSREQEAQESSSLLLAAAGRFPTAQLPASYNKTEMPTVRRETALSTGVTSPRSTLGHHATRFLPSELQSLQAGIPSPRQSVGLTGTEMDHFLIDMARQTGARVREAGIYTGTSNLQVLQQQLPDHQLTGDARLPSVDLSISERLRQMQRQFPLDGTLQSSLDGGSAQVPSANPAVLAGLPAALLASRSSPRSTDLRRQLLSLQVQNSGLPASSQTDPSNNLAGVDLFVAERFRQLQHEAELELIRRGVYLRQSSLMDNVSSISASNTGPAAPLPRQLPAGEEQPLSEYELLLLLRLRDAQRRR